MRLDEVIGWGGFAVLGHRGAPLSKTENTLESFLEAVALGADGVELDVHLSRDGVAVVCHDPDVLTSSGASVAVREARWSDLSGLDVVMGGKPGKLCRLEAVLEVLEGRLVDVELKDLPLGAPELATSRVGEVVAAIVRDRGMAERTLLTSFYIPHLQRAAETAHEIPRGWLIPPGMKASEAADLASAEGMSYLLPHTSAVPEDQGAVDSMVDELHRKGLELICWTVNDPEIASKLRAGGAAGVITDDPATTLAAIGRGGRVEGI